MAHLRAALELLSGDDSVRAAVTRSRWDRMLTLTEQLAELRIQIDALVKTSGSTLPEGLRRRPGRRGHHHRPRRRRARLPHPAPLRHRQRNSTHPRIFGGRTVRHRLSRGGNRQLNRALYTIAITQIRADTEGRAYYQRKRAEGKTSREALRCLIGEVSVMRPGIGLDRGFSVVSGDGLVAEPL